ncbi:MAG: methyltransferase domain-containing protein, partial [Vampirovibrionia bacterium]
MTHVCPWWKAYFFDNALRRFLQKPHKLLKPYVKPGMSTMDVGCGMGMFVIEMAKLVGDSGKVYAVDLQ